MNTIQNIIAWTLQNLDTIGAIVIGILSVLSGIFELLGKTTASKWCGTFSADVGRFIRWLKSRNLALKGGIVASVVLLAFVQGCALFRGATFWDSINEVCESSLVKTPEVQAKSAALKISPADVAGALCKIADVIEPFVREQMGVREGRAREILATTQAVSIAKSKGLL